MAKIKYSALVQSATGKLSGSVLQGAKSGAIIKNNRHKRKVMTGGQSKALSLFREGLHSYAMRSIYSKESIALRAAKVPFHASNGDTYFLTPSIYYAKMYALFRIAGNPITLQFTDPIPPFILELNGNPFIVPDDNILVDFNYMATGDIGFGSVFIAQGRGTGTNTKPGSWRRLDTFHYGNGPRVFALNNMYGHDIRYDSETYFIKLNTFAQNAAVPGPSLVSVLHK